MLLRETFPGYVSRQIPSSSVLVPLYDWCECLTGNNSSRGSVETSRRSTMRRYVSRFSRVGGMSI